MKITYLLPTCEPETMFRFLLPSIHFLKPLKHLIEFNICFQPPYTKKEIKQVLAEFKKQHIKVNYMFKNYHVIRPYTPLIKMRNDCAMMSPNSDIYGLLDDDMSFEYSDICIYIKDMIKQFKEESRLSVVSFYNQPVVNYRENFYSTNAGLYYRGGKYFGFKGLVPKYLNQFKYKVHTRIETNNENLINLFGGHQDKFCAMIRLATGTYGRCMLNVPVNHLENRLARGDKQHGWKDAEILEGSIADYILKYFNKNFIETHALTLFDKETNQLIYPYKYDKDGDLFPEYNIYDARGIIRNWFSNTNERYYGGNPYVVRYKEATYWSKWRKKSIYSTFKRYKDIHLLEHLPKDIIKEINSVLNKDKVRDRVITIFSVDFFGKNKFKEPIAKECYWSWNRSLSLPIRRLQYDVKIKIFDPRWEKQDLIIFKNKYREELKLLSDSDKEKLFILYIMSKYPNHLYMSPNSFTLYNTEFKNEEMFDSNWAYIYNKDNLEFFRKLFNKFKNKSLSNKQFLSMISKFTNTLNFESKC